ncbi:hypothetical protein Taro_001356 [Colocasia esculenta]|uniref:Uncharacterized protein n=1 Tax=Colocasia esculenta TaxID=4460 RepID=A0A843TFQ4_COLES|nr:hypothetical protein [Colocasia esculenta]
MQNSLGSVDTRSSNVDTRDSVSTLDQGSVDKPLTGVDTMLQTQGKIMQNCSSSVDTRSSSVDNRLQTQDKIMQNWSGSVDTRSSSVDTRDSSQKTFWPIWDSVSTLDQVVSTLEAFPEQLLG